MAIDRIDVLPRGRLAQPRELLLSMRIDTVVSIALLGAALVIGLATAQDYGLIVDEFNADGYGSKALAWYTSGFTDRSSFDDVEDFLWYYGPWPHMLTAFVQSFDLAGRYTVRHAMTFLFGWSAMAALIPIARLSFGRWAGPGAVALCLMTGYFYGSIFFTPIDVPFMAAMTWALLAILVMARREVPTWPAAIAAGVCIGLAACTRTAGIISHAYLVAAMLLCSAEVVVRHSRAAARTMLPQIAVRTLVSLSVAWIVMIALWPWLQIGNPFSQFTTAYRHFVTIPMSFEFVSWGQPRVTNALPWHYVPEQFLARLPEGFIVLFALALLFAATAAFAFTRTSTEHLRQRGIAGLRAPILVIARARATLLVVAATIVPIGFVMITRPTMYDSVRHILFTIPMLALLAGAALVELVRRLRRYPAILAVVAAALAAHAGATWIKLVRLHPLEYVSINAFAGGTKATTKDFELDYWAVSWLEAVKRLEARLDGDPRFLTQPPRVMLCLRDREWAADRFFRRNWIMEVDVSKADFFVATQRWRCDRETRNVVLLDEVKRFDNSYAWIFAGNRGLPDRR